MRKELAAGLMDIAMFFLSPLFLQLVDDEEAWEHGAPIEHHQLAAPADPDGVEVLVLAGRRCLRLRHAAGDDPAQEHGAAAGRGGAARRAGVRTAAAVERPDARGAVVLAACCRGRRRGGAVRRRRGEAHHLVAVGRAARGPAGPGAHRGAVVLEARHGARRVVHAEHHLHHARERAAAGGGGGRSRSPWRRRLWNRNRKRRRPRGEEDDLHHLPRRVPRRELGERRDRAERARRRRRRHSRRLRLGRLPLRRFGTRLGLGLGLRPAGGLGRDDVAEGVAGAPAASAAREERVELLGRRRCRDSGGHVVGRHGLAVEGPDPAPRRRGRAAAERWRLLRHEEAPRRPAGDAAVVVADAGWLCGAGWCSNSSYRGG